MLTFILEESLQFPSCNANLRYGLKPQRAHVARCIAHTEEISGCSGAYAISYVVSAIPFPPNRRVREKHGQLLEAADEESTNGPPPFDCGAGEVLAAEF